MTRVKVYPAEGFGAHKRSVEELSTEVEAVRGIAETAAGGGVEEAPVDGVLRGRKDAGWVAVAETPSDNFSGGLFDINDVATGVTPINVVGGGPTVVLTNDGAGPFSNSTYAPTGVTSVWDDIDSFDWSELKLGDMIDIRIDVDVTTSSVNTEVKIDLELGTGGGTYSIPWILETNYKSTGTHKLNRYNGIYMGDTNTLDNGGQFMVSSDKDCTVVVNGWYVKIIKRG